MEPKVVAAELTDRGAAHELHAALELGAHQAERTLDARLAGHREREQVEPSEAYGLGTQGEGLEDVRGALDAAVYRHVQALADRVDHLCKLVERCARAVELTAAVIGQDDAGATYVGGALRIRDRHYPLEAELSVPVAHHRGDVVPIHRRIEHLREIASDRHRAAAHVDVILELRQPEPLMRNVVERPHRLERELQHS